MTGFAPSIGAGLCHGDLIGDNLLRDRGGRLWPGDWDAAALAPRELYVSLFTAGGFTRFLDGCQRDTGGPSPRCDAIAFFLLRRNFDDLADWLLRGAGRSAAGGEAARGSEWRAVVFGVLGWARRTHRARPRGGWHDVGTRHRHRVCEGWLCGGYRFHQRLYDRPIPERMSHNATHSSQM